MGMWDEHERMMLRKAFQVCLGDYCRMSVLLHRSCASIYHACTSEEDQSQVSRAALDLQAATRTETQPAERKGRKRGGIGFGRQRTSRKQTYASSIVGRQRTKEQAEMLVEFVPCAHEGPCTDETRCSCAMRRHFCGPECLCPPTCKNRFPGCVCKRTMCRTRACPCFAAERECDPDLCINCGTCEMDSRTGRPTCCNSNLLFHRHAHLMLGHSTIRGAGWGIFSRDRLRKDMLVQEYVQNLCEASVFARTRFLPIFCFAFPGTRANCCLKRKRNAVAVCMIS